MNADGKQGPRESAGAPRGGKTSSKNDLVPTNETGTPGTTQDAAVDGGDALAPRGGDPEKVESRRKDLQDIGERQAQDKATKVLEMLQGTSSRKGNLIDPDGKHVVINSSDLDSSTPSMYDSLPDPLQQMKNVPLLMHSNKKTPWEEEENPSEEYLERKEAERLANIQTSRGRVFTWSLNLLFHFCVMANFVMACVDSFKLMATEGTLQALLLKGDFNCLGIRGNNHIMTHVVHIFQALMSSMVLYADNRLNASLCMSCVFAQALHASFKAFSFFMQMRFDRGYYFVHKIIYFTIGLITDVVVSVVTIQRFYDLTDRIRVRSSNFAVTTEGMSMNNEIIYQNQSSFLQRKHILREAIACQVYTVIQKIDNYREKGLEVDHLELFKELYAAKDALSDVNDVENRNLLKELKKATANRFREYGTDPNLLKDKNVTVGAFSKIFVVDFGGRDNPLSTCKPVSSKKETAAAASKVASVGKNESLSQRSSVSSTSEDETGSVPPQTPHTRKESEFSINSTTESTVV